MVEVAFACLAVVTVSAMLLCWAAIKSINEGAELLLTLARDLTTEARAERAELLERIQRPERSPVNVPPRHTEEPRISPEAARNYASIGTVSPLNPPDVVA